jgi:hypothetical protein
MVNNVYMEQLLKPNEVDDLLRYSPGKANRLAKQGKIPHIKLPTGEVRFEWADVKKFINGDFTMEHEFDQRDGIVAGILMRAGLEKFVETDMGPKLAQIGHERRNCSLIDDVNGCRKIDGGPESPNQGDMLRTAFASLTLPYILGAVANKSALFGYRSAPATWRKFCSTGTVNNFQTQTRARLTDRGELEKVNNAGEVGSGTATEEKEQYSIATYGKTFPITRQNIIDDNIQELTKTPKRFGRKAGLLISKLVFTHLLANGNMGDGIALFHADHLSLNTSCALSEAGLTKAFKVFAQQVDADGQSIGVLAKYLVVPPELWITAKRLCESDLRLYGGDTEATAMAKNVFGGLLEVICEPRLSNSTYTGYSTTTWYLAADPIEIDTVEIAFLNGKEEPTIEKFDADPETLGIIYRIYLDVGVKALDWRGMSKNEA